MLYCPECGTFNPEASNFCSECGRRLTQPSPAHETLPLDESQVSIGDVGLFKGNLNVAGSGSAQVSLRDVAVIEKLTVGVSVEELKSLLENLNVGLSEQIAAILADHRRLFPDAIRMVHENSNTVGDRFELRKLIGRSGIGRVYLAQDTWHNKLVAVKIFPDFVIHDPHVRELFLSETSRLTTLSHPNIARTVAVSTAEEPIAYIATELVEGRTLAHLLLEGGNQGFPFVILAPVITQVCSAIAHAHAQEPLVIHGDIRPGNIVITSDGTIKVLDFAIPFLIRDCIASFGSDNSPVTEVSDEHWARDRRSTVPYLAPEYLAARRISPALDQYALGATIYECLRGTPPFLGDQYPASDINRSFMPLDAVPAQVNEVLRRALMSAPSERWPSVTALCEAFSLPTRLSFVTGKSRSLKTWANLAQRTTGGGSGSLQRLKRYIDAEDVSGSERSVGDWLTEITKLRRTAQDCMMCQRWEEAATLWEDILKLDPTSFEAARQRDLCRSYAKQRNST